jgi:hypothetical protein
MQVVGTLQGESIVYLTLNTLQKKVALHNLAPLWIVRA